MSYLRNPHVPNMWESDGDEPWGKYKAADGTFHDSARQADKHDRDRGWHPWDSDRAAASKKGSAD